MLNKGADGILWYKQLFYDDIVHEFGEIMQNKGHFAIQGHRYLYQSKAHIRLLIKTIARPVLCIKS